MSKFFVSAGLGLVSGVLSFFLSVAFLCFVLLLSGAVSHTHPDMTLAYKVAAPVAILAALTGFTVALVRGIRRRSTAQ